MPVAAAAIDLSAVVLDGGVPMAVLPQVPWGHTPVENTDLAFLLKANRCCWLVPRRMQPVDF